MDLTLFPKLPVLIVDDEENILNSLEVELLSNNITNVECCQDSLDVMPRLRKNEYSVILLDLFMPGKSGEELLPEIIKTYPKIPVIVVTAFPEDKTVIDCLKNGAFDYLTKPINIKDLIRTIRDALKLKDAHEKIVQLKKDLFLDSEKIGGNFLDIITKSNKMLPIFQTLGLYAVTSRPLLMTGEKGVGKEFIARKTHELSRRDGKFIRFENTGLDEEDFNNTLFGQKIPGSGAVFSGGLLKDARGGTLYITEVGDIPLKSQEKFLGLLQDWEYLPTGKKNPLESSARVIAATNKNLAGQAQIKAFRKDLYYKLISHEIIIPPLRKRMEDLPLILDFFVQEAAKEKGIPEPSIPDEIFPILTKYDFPGNISELKKMVYDAITKSKDGVLPKEVFL